MNENRVVAYDRKGKSRSAQRNPANGRASTDCPGGEGGVRDISGLDRGLVLPDGRQRVVRHGHDPVRAIQTGIGPVEVQKPKARDRAAVGGAPSVLVEHPAEMGAAHQKSRRSVASSLSARDFSRRFPGGPRGLARQGRAQPLRGGDRAPRERVGGRISAMAARDFSARHYVYVWADGVYLQARMEPQAECMLVLMGATAEGRKELIGFQTGMRESGQSWKELLVDLKARGLVVAPQVAIGDGALGFWKALDEAFPTTRHQRCWLHKTLNVLDKLPKSLQPNAHKDLREIWLSPDRGAAEAAMTTFAEKYAPKYDKAVECLIKDRQTLLTFFDLPADHWDHLRTSNPIESVFATVRHRTVRMKGALSQDTARLMVFKLVMAASRPGVD